MLGSIVSCLASPRKILGEKKNLGWNFFLRTQDHMKQPEMHKKVKVSNFFGCGKKIWLKIKKKNSESESCLKLPELPRNYISRRGGWVSCHGWTDRQTTGWHPRVTCRVAPCEQQGMTKNGNSVFLVENRMAMSFGKKLVTLKVSTKMSKLVDNACLWCKKTLNFIFFISVFSVLPLLVLFAIFAWCFVTKKIISELHQTMLLAINTTQPCDFSHESLFHWSWGELGGLGRNDVLEHLLFTLESGVKQWCGLWRPSNRNRQLKEQILRMLCDLVTSINTALPYPNTHKCKPKLQLRQEYRVPLTASSCAHN